MNILSNILLDQDSLIAPITTDISSETMDSGPQQLLEDDFSEYINAQLPALHSSVTPIAALKAETNFHLPANASPGMPMSNLLLQPLNSDVAADLQVASEPVIGEKLVANPESTLFKNMDGVLQDNTFEKNISDNILPVETEKNGIELHKLEQSQKIDIDEAMLADTDLNLDSKLLASKNQSISVAEQFNDINASSIDKAIININKAGATQSVAESVLSTSKENYTLTADSSFTEKLGEQIELLIRNNQKEAKIALDPAGLGKIDVQIKMVNNEYVVNMLTQNEGAQQLLDQHSAKLKQLFNNENMTFNLSQQGQSDRSTHDNADRVLNHGSDHLESNNHKGSLPVDSNQFVKNTLLPNQSVSLYI